MQIRSWRLLGLLTHTSMLCSAVQHQGLLRGVEVEQHEQHSKPSALHSEDFCSNAAAPGPIWVYFGLTADWLPTFNPMINTLEDGLQQVLTKREEPLTLRTAPNMPDMVTEIKQRVKAGCKETPVVICISCIPLPDEDTQALHELTSMGTYLVAYNTEYTSFYRNESVRWAHELGAKEVWTYSRSVLASFPPDHPKVIRRYLPPGCASKLFFNVSFEAELRHLSKVGFLGYLGARDDSVIRALHGSWNMHHIFEGRAGTDEQFRRYMEKFPVQVNFHKNITSDLPMEAFRAAQLLTNGACYLSQSVHPLDYEEFKDLAIFDTVEGLGKLWNNTLMGNEAAIRECQDRFQKLYCQRFDPLRLLRNSGFVSVLKEQNYDLRE